MEVTKSNFQEVLTELDDVLKNATFLGIDGEFTGLNSGPDANAFDTPAQYYAKLRAGSMNFLLVQFGLSVFTFDKETQRYSQRSYNFYVFPRPLNRSAPDCRFMCQASCISFLARQGFDFNKLFNMGIPYLSTSEEEKLMKQLEERQKARDEVPATVQCNPDDVPELEKICSKIDEFFASEEEELTIDGCNGYFRKVVQQEVKERWSNTLKIETKSNCSGYSSLVIKRSGTKEEEEQKETERRKKEVLEIKEAVGLSTLLRKIVESGKLIVGHNMLLDLCHIIHKFFGPLPENYHEFKSLTHSLFPRILDTKALCQSQQFKKQIPSSNLNELLETVSKPPFTITEVEPIDGRSYSTLAEKCHEAGYDAYITGICFLALCNYVGSLQQPEVPIVLADSQLLNPFLNKLLIPRLKDLPYINLVGKDPIPSRDHVYHITFPKHWTYNQISQLFNPFGGVYVSWLSDTSAFVSLYRRNDFSIADKHIIKQSSKHKFKIQKYADYQASLNTNASTRDNKRKSSPESDTVKKEENSVTTSGVKRRQDNDGWEVVTGNKPMLRSTSTTSYPDSHELSKTTSETRKNNNSKKLAQRIRSTKVPSLSMSVDETLDAIDDKQKQNGHSKVVSCSDDTRCHPDDKKCKGAIPLSSAVLQARLDKPGSANQTRQAEFGEPGSESRDWLATPQVLEFPLDNRGDQQFKKTGTIKETRYTAKSQNLPKQLSEMLVGAFIMGMLLCQLIFGII